MRILLAVALTLALGTASAQEANAPMPSMLPAYYGEAFRAAGGKLLLEHTTKDGIDRWVYSTGQLGSKVVIESLPCERPRCNAAFDNVRAYFNKVASENKGRFLSAEPDEIHAEWHPGFESVLALALKLPQSILFWTAVQSPRTGTAPDFGIDTIRAAANRQRYEQALAEGNVAMGQWAPAIRAYTKRLLDGGRTSEAATTLRNLLATSPYDYEAHLDFAAITPDRSEARQSLTTIFRNSEDVELAARAAQLLGETLPETPSVPVVSPEDAGLRVVVIPLAPVDVRLVDEAARIYEKITDVPVIIRRLPESWEFGTPDRIADQNAVQEWIVKRTGRKLDFNGWDKERYVSELLELADGSDALTRFATTDFATKLSDRPGQYTIDRHLERLLDLLGPLRARDERTMYVGVTGANITSGSNNYLFSLHMTKESGSASILSYAMMQAHAAGDGYESRRRLAERLAKELVPASLKSLRIPRPTDPTDPYSYSDGVRRLGEKTLTLSEPTRAALDRFR